MGLGINTSGLEPRNIHFEALGLGPLASALGINSPGTLTLRIRKVDKRSNFVFMIFRNWEL